MSDLRTAAQQALETLENMHGCKLRSGLTINTQHAVAALRTALAEPCPPPEAKTEAERLAYAAGWWAALSKR